VSTDFYDKGESAEDSGASVPPGSIRQGSPGGAPGIVTGPRGPRGIQGIPGEKGEKGAEGKRVSKAL